MIKSYRIEYLKEMIEAIWKYLDITLEDENDYAVQDYIEKIYTKLSEIEDLIHDAEANR